jgi:hypothetical protein
VACRLFLFDDVSMSMQRLNVCTKVLNIRTNPERE